MKLEQLKNLQNKYLVKYLIVQSKYLGWLEDEHSITEADKIKRLEIEIKEIEKEFERRLK